MPYGINVSNWIIHCIFVHIPTLRKFLPITCEKLIRAEPAAKLAGVVAGAEEDESGFEIGRLAGEVDRIGEDEVEWDGDGRGGSSEQAAVGGAVFRVLRRAQDGLAPPGFHSGLINVELARRPPQPGGEAGAAQVVGELVLDGLLGVSPFGGK